MKVTIICLLKTAIKRVEYLEISAGKRNFRKIQNDYKNIRYELLDIIKKIEKI